MNITRLTKKISRIEARCKIFNESFDIWVDTGSPNTLVSSKFPERFGLSPVGARRYSGKVAGVLFRSKPSITIPEIVFPKCLPLRNVRALAALEDDVWDGIVVLAPKICKTLVS